MSNNKYKVIVIEDEYNIQSFMQAILEAHGYQVILAASGAQAKMMINSWLPDLIILDLGLPDLDGQDLIQEIRGKTMVPIVVVSARMGETDKVEALDRGANDYMTKPFGTEELLARVRAALRNSRGTAGKVLREGVFRVGDMTIDYDIRRVYIDNKEISLTQTEYNIVALLSQYAGKVMTYDAIIRAIWGTNEVGGIKKLQVNMANIRRKMGAEPGANRYILTEMGVGYRMVTY
jgi:Response regulators consisting of a CheY-like receiver domain and a winged-helix DNA-binding domain